MKEMVILLTATVNPDGTALTKLQDPRVRKEQYIRAIEFYLINTNYNIVLCENTNCNFYNEISDLKKDRLEFIVFNGNNYNKSYGKGYGEARIIKYAIENSNFLKDAKYIVKITGRIIIKNINEIFAHTNSKYSSKYLFLSLTSKWGFINSVCMILPKDWIYRTILLYGHQVRDSNFNFESMIYESTINSNIKIQLIYPFIYGICGGNNKLYFNFPIVSQKKNNYYVLTKIYNAQRLKFKGIYAKIKFTYYRIVEKINNLL